MYYYIFDIKKCKKRSQVEAIKDYLGGLGISGEFAVPSAAQSVAELVDLGLSKQYSTIVGIGSDSIANEMASKLAGRKEAMGFIPLEVSPELASLIGTDNWKDACDILRFRKITEIRLGKTASGQYFLTYLNLGINGPVEITMELKDCIVSAKVKNFVVANYYPAVKKLAPDYLDILMTSVDPKGPGFLGKISTLINGEKHSELSTSLFHARSLRIFSKNQVPIMSHNTQIAKTPQLIESSDELLRLITAKKASTFWEE